ncbi:MAG: ABC transporter substrate-binding protein [Aggregatilineales bacterium]
MRKMLMLLCLLLLIPTLSAQDELQEEQFLLTFIPNIQFSPIYIAEANGYFAEAGYDITVDYLNEPDVVDLVAAGQANFGMVSGEQVIMAAAQGRPVIFVYEWFQQYPIGVVVPAESDIETVDDLAGKVVGIPGLFGASYSGFTTLLSSAGMIETDVTLEAVGFNAPEVFCTGRVDASVVYINNEPLQITNRAIQDDCGEVRGVRVLPVSTSADLVSNGIVTSQALIESDPEKVAAFVGAYDAGLNDVINNPAEAYLLSAEYVENLPLSDAMRGMLENLSTDQKAFLAEDPDASAIADSRQGMLDALRTDFRPDELIQFEVLLASIDLWTAEQTGFSDLSSWDAMLETLVAMDMLSNDVDISTLFTNDYLPE